MRWAKLDPNYSRLSQQRHFGLVRKWGICVDVATRWLVAFLQHATIVNITGKSYRLRHGGKTEGATPEDSKEPALNVPKGRRSTAGGEGLSLSEDTVAESQLSSDVGQPAQAGAK